MHILRFDILNSKAIESFVHDANGEHVEIAGQTATGKTTCASALWEIANRSKDCLKHGERKGHIILHLGEGKPDLIASREFTKKTNTVKIERADGAPVSIKEFRDMISSLSENPHRIADMKPTERVKTLLAAADIGDADLDKMDEEIAGAERIRLAAKQRADDFVPGVKPDKVEPVDVSALSTVMEEAHAHNEGIEQDKREIDEIIRSGKELAAEAEEWRGKIVEAEAAMQEARSRHGACVDRRDALVVDYKKRTATHALLQATDTAPVQVKLASATEINRKATAYEQWVERDKQYKELMQQRGCADETVKELREYKKDLLENAKWPLEGLSVEDGDVVYNGALFDNLGQSERHLVCAALAIKDIKAHPLKVCRMDGVESMSKEDFGKLKKLFGDEGIQIISTRVAQGETEPGELVISEKEGANAG